MEGLTPGRIVHFVTVDGLHLAALVVTIFNKQEGRVGLQSFDMLGSVGRHDVPYDESGKTPYSWHWIEKA